MSINSINSFSTPTNQHPIIYYFFDFIFFQNIYYLYIFMLIYIFIFSCIIIDIIYITIFKILSWLNSLSKKARIFCYISYIFNIFLDNFFIILSSIFRFLIESKIFKYTIKKLIWEAKSNFLLIIYFFNCNGEINQKNNIYY